MSGRSESKVIGVGFHKTGTSSLGRALEMLGYTVCGCKTQLVKGIREGDLSSALKMAQDYQAFQDFPWPILFRELDQAFPGSRFVLTMRDEESWLKSNLNHFGSRSRESLQWIYGADCPRGNEQRYLERFREHNETVLGYFSGREADLLVLDIQAGDGWDKLCPFLGQDVPVQPFPHRQKARYGLDKYTRPRNLKKVWRDFLFRRAGKVKPL